ncbi:MAG TPA: helix-turn-helix transcriptional regulator [Acidimicrobiales bacterium]|nr:helix-turn-helix transcriptional regulator [Acidimicrobiales bacterium]
MNTLAGLTFGERVAYMRRRRDMSQRMLAAAIDRSESWVSQVERDVLPVERLSVLQRLADALGCSMFDLEPSTASVPRSGREDERTPTEDLDGVRAVLSGHPALPSVLRPGGGPVPGTDADHDELDRAIGEAWALAHGAQLAELGRVLAEALPQLEAAVRQGADAATERDLHRLRARGYQAAAAAFARLDEPDAAWVAADRAIAAAEQAGDPLGVVAGLYRMAHAFLRLGRYGQAERIATTALDALDPLVAPGVPDRPGGWGASHRPEPSGDRGAASGSAASGSAGSGAATQASAADATGLAEAVDPPAALSLAGAMHLVRAVIAAREGRRGAARDDVDAARRLAARLGGDRNDHDTEFGPTNVEAHAVAVAVELGDAGEALEIAEVLDVSTLSPERRARFLVDLARAHTQRRHLAAATDALVEAEKVASEQVRGHELVRETVRDLLQLAGRNAPDELRGLAHRTAAVPL